MDNFPVLLRNFQKEINKLFDRSFFQEGWPTIHFQSEIWNPKANIEDQGEVYQVTVHLPGIEPEKIQVTFQGQVLTIQGNIENKEEKKNYLQYECHCGAFLRSFYLPQTQDDAKVEAIFKNGVLTIKVPKTKETTRKRIEIKT